MVVCHLTSAHSQEDIRIFHKECVSLAKAGYETYQISCGDNYDKCGVHCIGIGKQQKSRIKRMTVTAKKAYQEARKLDADAYHFHDPELLPFALRLKRSGKTVIFDSHEEIPAQIMDKTWIPRPFRKIVAIIYKAYETHAVKHFDAVVAATPHIAKAFKGRCNTVVVVNNYPKLDDITYHNASFEDRDPIACYAGGIDESRGEFIMIEAMKGVGGRLIIAGEHEVGIINEQVEYLGTLDRNGVNELYGKAVVGLCILKPIENYYYSKPIKIYEYMAAGLPYICSDFPDWRIVAEKSGAGICVNPDNIEEIRAAIIKLLHDRKMGQEMGFRGRQYVLTECNWDNEEKTLIALYSKLFN